MVNESDFRPRLLDYLPPIYQGSEEIGSFLAAFETTLFEPVTSELAETKEPTFQKSLERLIDEIPALFDPEEVTPEFLPWLAQWAAVSASESIPEFRRRQLIQKMIPLYGIRGTKAYIEQTLALYTGLKAVVEEEDLPGMRVGVLATVGQDTRLGQDPFQFRVFLDFSSVPDRREQLPELLKLADLVVNLGKPAHTHFRLVHNVPEEEKGLVISVRSTVGIDTLLWV